MVRSLRVSTVSAISVALLFGSDALIAADEFCVRPPMVEPDRLFGQVSYAIAGDFVRVDVEFNRLQGSQRLEQVQLYYGIERIPSDISELRKLKYQVELPLALHSIKNKLASQLFLRLPIENIALLFRFKREDKSVRWCSTLYMFSLSNERLDFQKRLGIIPPNSKAESGE